MIRWVDIIGYQDLYQVSDSGLVRRIKPKIKDPLKPSMVRGYRSVILSKNHKIHRFSVHRLVALHFVSNPHNLKVVNHKDGVKLNNHYSNLEWCTIQHNATHAKTNGLLPKWDKSATAKLTNYDVVEMRRLWRLGASQKFLVKKFNISMAQVYNITNNKQWQ